MQVYDEHDYNYTYERPASDKSVNWLISSQTEYSFLQMGSTFTTISILSLIYKLDDKNTHYHR